MLPVGIVRPPKSCKGKPILFYTNLTRNGDFSIPVASYLSESHTSTQIENFFREIKICAEKISKKKFQPQIIVVDKSKALIGAALRVFNNEDLTTYVNEAYGTEFQDKEMKPKTLIRICSAHFMNQVLRKIRNKEY
ncbi:UNVERIFIED_CONTAM: hypothetical protein RMT77_014562 [Armadillidium vulgare]